MQQLAWPFRGSEVLEDGSLTYRELRQRHISPYPGVWVPRGVELSHRDLTRAAWLWSGRVGVPVGLSAAMVLGTKWIDADQPAELIHGNRRPPRGLIVHTDDLRCGETQLASGMVVTTPARTAFDIGRRLPLTAGVQRLDALLNATGVKVIEVESVIAAHPGVRGLRQLRETLALVDGGAESPYESLTRLLLIQNGFPRPETQIKVFDENGEIFARIDMGWRQYRVGVDFEGAGHWTDPRRREWDVERYARLPVLGWTDIRATSTLVHNRPRVFLDRVGTALLARGCPRTW